MYKTVYVQVGKGNIHGLFTPFCDQQASCFWQILPEGNFVRVYSANNNLLLPLLSEQRNIP